MDLNDNLLQSLNENGFKAPTLIQQLAIVPATQNRNMLIQSQSGTGKTLVFSIATLAKTNIKKALQTIIISPSRELSHQSYSIISKLSKYNKVSVINITGGNNYAKDKLKLKDKT